jgi:hypothetical protein
LTQSYGQYLRTSDFIEKLPLFCAKNYPQKQWYERDVFFTTADGSNKYLQDKDFIKSCLIWTCLTRKNKCRSFDGTDGRKYKNEICLKQNTQSDKKIGQFVLMTQDNEVVDLFLDVLNEAKQTKKYNPSFTYGVFQIDEELNTFVKSEDEKKVYDYPNLNTKIIALRNKIKDYYHTEIESKLFKYELLK